jgi:hypothetical protein
MAVETKWPLTSRDAAGTCIRWKFLNPNHFEI